MIINIYYLTTKINMYLQGSVAAVEYLILNNVDIDAHDGEGKTPVHLATELGNNFYYFT